MGRHTVQCLVQHLEEEAQSWPQRTLLGLAVCRRRQRITPHQHGIMRLHYLRLPRHRGLATSAVDAMAAAIAAAVVPTEAEGDTGVVEAVGVAKARNVGVANDGNEMMRIVTSQIHGSTQVATGRPRMVGLQERLQDGLIRA